MKMISRYFLFLNKKNETTINQDGQITPFFIIYFEEEKSSVIWGRTSYKQCEYWWNCKHKYCAL